MLPAAINDWIAALVPPTHDDPIDKRIWLGDRLGSFFISSAYALLRAVDDSKMHNKWRIIWKVDVPECVRFFVWQLLHGKLLTNTMKHRWGLGTPFCPVCN